MERKSGLFGFSALLVLVAGLLVNASTFWHQKVPVFGTVVPNGSIALASPAASVASPYYYNFNVDGDLEEANSAQESSSPYWWVESGGRMIISNGLGKTIQGNLPANDPWRLSYNASNPGETDSGYHPQNIFRFFSRSKWQNVQEEAYFRIAKDNLSISPSRQSYNGLFLYSRYQDGSNFYYGGLRVDGALVIKKKIGGKYYTLGYKKVSPGTYDRSSNPNLLPKNTWLGLRLVSQNNADGTLTLKVLLDNGKTGNWNSVLEVRDDAKTYGGAAFLNEGMTGLKSDFMDVEFDNFRLTSIGNNSTINPPPPPPADTTPPVRSNGLPSGTLAAGTLDTTLSLATNENATCKFGSSSASFVSLPSTLSSTGGTSHLQKLSGLTNGASYNYYVRCRDAAGNVNTDDYKISFAVANPAPPPPPPPPPASNGSYYGLDSNGTVEETGSAGESTSPHWWVNSGAYFYVSNGTARTILGSLPSGDKWRQIYASANPYDTDNGYHPQNIFRLITKKSWQNFEQEGYFRIVRDQLSASSNREGHNALLFFNRYRDSQNLYYTGIRVDGRAVIKKKLGGRYYTLALKPVFSGTYNRDTNPNLLPHDTWIGLRSVVRNNPDGSVNIRVYMENGRTGNWRLIAEATDNASNYGMPIRESAPAGIRTDFMDVEITGYKVTTL